MLNVVILHSAVAYAAATMYTLLRSVLASSTLLYALTSASSSIFPSPPSELFSPLVSSKILTIAQNPPNPIEYPEYTDRIVGNWTWFNPDLWTTGFFPATLYAMHTRAELCPSVGNKDEWLTLGRSWSTPEIPLELHNSVEHDVGFLSYPFMDELKVSVSAHW